MSAPTWHRANLSSEIDFIWAYQPILQYLTDYETDDSDTSTLSDYKILISRWLFPYATTGQQRHKTRTRRRVFNYKAMNKEEWENFADQVSSNLQLHHTPLIPTSSESLETTWYKIQTSLIIAALKHIPNK